MLTIYHGQEAYQSIEIVAIAPNHDLALVKINNLSGPTPYLHLKSTPLHGKLSDKLTVYGSASTFTDIQKLSGDLTADGYVLSAAIRDPQNGNRLFRPDDMKLITLQMPIYKGMSGGPVILNEDVVGVLSGSFNPGNSLGWAIPSIYAARDQMLPVNVNVPLTKRYTWPPLLLMLDESHLDMLRRSFSLSAGLSLSLDAYLRSVDDLSIIGTKLLSDYKGQCDSLHRFEQLEEKIQRAIDTGTLDTFAREGIALMYCGDRL